MAAGRVSAGQRIKLSNRAELEINKYKDDHYRWHVNIHNVHLDPLQVLKCEEMDRYKSTIDFSSRRTRKTSVKELYMLRWNALYPHQMLGIVAPRLQQSQTNLKYHTEAIARSEILSAYIARDRGRRQLADTYYRFHNKSGAIAYGIQSQVDGDDITAASLEEVDDMPPVKLGNFMLMMAATERMGAALGAVNEPQVRITGVYKGADTLTDMLKLKDSKGDLKYHALGCLRGADARAEIMRFIAMGYLDETQIDLNGYDYPVPRGNVIKGMEMGLLQVDFIDLMRSQLSADEFARQLLCINMSSRNLIWDKWVQSAVQLGVRANLDISPPMPGGKYKKRGLLSFGYDASGHGEAEDASRHAFIVCEELHGFIVPIWARTWEAGEDDNVVRRDLLSYWRYYEPDYAIGDAYGVGMLTALNDDLYDQDLTTVNRKEIDGGKSTESSWDKWPFSPMRFEGSQKHIMASSVRALFSQGRTAIPYFEDDLEISEKDTDSAGLKHFKRQLTNIKKISSSKTYASYKMINKKIGDDVFDAFLVGAWALITQGTKTAKTTINIQQKTREQLMGTPSLLSGGL